MAETLEEYVEGLVLTEVDGVTQLVPDSAERDRILAELEQARADLDAMRQDRAARRRLGDAWIDWVEPYLDAVTNWERDLEQLDQRIGAARQGLTREHYLILDVDERREVLGDFLDAIMVRPSRGRGRNVDPIERRVRVLWRGQGPSELPERRVVTEIRSFEFEDDVEAGVPTTQDGT